jgi:hypothetical protein
MKYLLQGQRIFLPKYKYISPNGKWNKEEEEK